MSIAPSVFKGMFDASQLEEAVEVTLKKWWKTYAREFERQVGMDADSLPTPRAWVVAEAVEREGTDQLPTVVIVSPGLNGTAPFQEGDGSFRATWVVGVGIFVSAATRADTARLVRQYGAIIRAIMEQKQSFGGVACGSVWLDESYDDNFAFTDDLTISAGQVVFDIEVDGVMNRFAGPVGEPDADDQPGSQWPAVDTVEIEIEKEGIGG